MKSTIFAAFSFAAVSVWAQPAIAPPQVGFIQDQVGSFRPVYGLAGNFVVGDPSATGVLSAAFSGSWGWLKTDSAVLVTDRRGRTVATARAPAGPALFAFSRDGQAALAYMKDSLFQWRDGTVVAVPMDLTAIAADTVWSIAAPDTEHAAFMVERNHAIRDIRIVLATGEVDSQTALDGVNPPVLMLANGDVVWTNSDGLVVRGLDGSQAHIAAQLPDSFSLRQMGDGWLQLGQRAAIQRRHAHEFFRTSNSFAVRISKNREGFYALPELSQ